MFARPILRRIATGRLSSCERIGSTQRRLASKSAKSKSLHGLLKAETDTAQRLLNTGHWRVGRAKGEKRAKIDTRRVNIVSEKLCCKFTLLYAESVDEQGAGGPGCMANCVI